jgi:hypothetical protein
MHLCGDLRQKWPACGAGRKDLAEFAELIGHPGLELSSCIRSI